MASSSPLAPLHDLKVVKQQLVILVTIIATLFVLCPQWLQFYRNLCLIPLIAWFTAMAFDIVILLNDKWDNAPAMVKYFVPVDFPKIAPPFEQIRSIVNRRVALSSTRLRQFILEIKPLMLALIDWLLCQMGRGSLNNDSQGTQQGSQTASKPKPDRWVAVVVTTPPPYSDSVFGIDRNDIDEVDKLVSWESTEVSSIPAILSTQTPKVQLTLCLIPKSTWYSSKTVLERFTAGLYWNHQPGSISCQGEQWDEERIQTISKVQVIGQVEAQNKIHQVNEYFDSLRQGWDETNTYWNDIDFAIIFGFLLVGSSSADVCKKLFEQFATGRIEQAQRNKRSQLGAGAAILTLLTGGLAAPVTIPMMMGAGAAEMTMSKRDRFLWEQRRSMCKELLDRYQQLTAIIDLDDKKILTPAVLAPEAFGPDAFAAKAPFAAPAMESSWFVDDAW
ncbi:hypothetical protein FHETE_2395 [Fusarium heterosporum]|uniref:Uncharacterized protein n=1 Tax=Fusarium heterosporum TaxID=42747 RepID=A0A8H5TUE2_FUSHE|nr:hypothetical protein FHETE_2395 [Fusarium heterosporum]